MRFTAWLTFCAVLSAVLVTATALAAPPQAAEVLAAAERADRDLDFARALAGYEEVALREATDPGDPAVARAAARARVLRDRSEGGFAPLALLERVRRDPKLASSAPALEDLLAKVDGGAVPPGLVRVEIWVLVAEAFAARLDRPADAAPLWRKIAIDPHADPVTVRNACTSLVVHHLRRGDVSAAEEVVAIERGRLASAAAQPDASLEKLVRRARVRRSFHAAALAVLIAVGVGAAVAIARAGRTGRIAGVLRWARRSGRLAAAYAAYLATVVGLLAAEVPLGPARPFLLFAAALVPLLLVARAWAAAGAPTRRARAGRAALCAAGALGTAFLVLEQLDIAHLERLGL